jgi:predicted RNA-binding Zn-ribbon protein involved in translation (DUF1610 family)
MERGEKMLDSKQVKFICPNKCGNFAMLNRGVSLALCQKPECNYVMMVPERTKEMKGSRDRNNKNNKSKPFACDKCGKEGMRVLTLVDYRKKAICDECSKTYISTSTWKTYPSKNSNE